MDQEPRYRIELQAEWAYFNQLIDNVVRRIFFLRIQKTADEAKAEVLERLQ